MLAVKKRSPLRTLCLFLALSLLTSLKFFSLYSNARDSEAYVDSMISAGTIGLEIPGSFGLVLLESDGVVYDGVEGGNQADSALYIAYHPQDFDAGNVQVNLIRLQQLGLQGQFAYLLGSLCRAVHAPARAAYFLYRWANAILLSATLLAIALQLRKAYDELFALVFFAVSVLSTWVTEFAANLYWIEFSWFLPMLFGLMALNYPRKRGWFYLLAALSVALKSSCGYEYITTVMLGSVVFLAAKWLAAAIRKAPDALRLFRSLLGVGFASLFGFAFTLLLHAYLRCNGDVYAGIVDIIYCDVLRRTVGDPVVSSGGTSVTVPVSVLSVLVRYWLLSVTGLLATGSLLANLVLLARRKDRRAALCDLVLLVLGALASSSWYILAKSHSYIHHHLNGVLFYLPFMQISVYLLLRQLIGRRLARCAGEERERLAARFLDRLGQIAADAGE